MLPFKAIAASACFLTFIFFAAAAQPALKPLTSRLPLHPGPTAPPISGNAGFSTSWAVYFLDDNELLLIINPDPTWHSVEVWCYADNKLHMHMNANLASYELSFWGRTQILGANANRSLHGVWCRFESAMPIYVAIGRPGKAGGWPSDYVAGIKLK